MDFLQDFIRFLKDSPSSFHAIESTEKMITKKPGMATSVKTAKPGSWFFVTKKTKDGAALIAADIGENAAEHGFPLNIAVSHCDSPWFEAAEDEFEEGEGLAMVKTKRYGGFSVPVWQDRPLTLAGRVCVSDGARDSERLIYLTDETFIVPSMCFHFHKYIEEGSIGEQGYPLVGSAELSSKGLKAYLAKKLGLPEESIKDYKLCFVSKQEPEVWGENKEFLSAGRLDDLACVYTSAESFVNTHDPNAINILYVSDNEEIGSATEVGAGGSLLKDTLSSIADKLDFNLEEALKRSFMLSADNAQGVHPHHSYIYNPNYKVCMNKGFAVKMSTRYATTEDSLKVYKSFCEKSGLPCQVFYNREDIKGGGTVGKLIQELIPIEAADIGLPQLSMHSACETMGSTDIENGVKLFDAFFNSFLLEEYR